MGWGLNHTRLVDYGLLFRSNMSRYYLGGRSVQYKLEARSTLVCVAISICIFTTYFYLLSIIVP